MIFFSFFPQYADVENMLVPLNRLVEQDYTQHNRQCPWLAKLVVMNERVLAKDVRNNNTIKRARLALGKDHVTIGEVVDNLMENYDEVHRSWLARTRYESKTNRQREWVFRAMWPVAALTSRNMDWKDPETRDWVVVLGILLSVSVIASGASLFILFWCCETSGSPLSIALWRAWYAGGVKSIPTDDILANAVMCYHSLVVLWLIYRSVWGMFYQQLVKRISHRTSLAAVFAVYLVLGLISVLFRG